MDDSTTSPPPLQMRISPEHANYEKSLPPSPPPSTRRSRSRASSKTRTPSTSSPSQSPSPSSPSKQHHHHHHHSSRPTPNAKDLLRLLTSSQSTTQSLEHELNLVTSQLAFEQDRADTAERKLRDTITRFKDIHEAHTRSQTDLARVSEELRLYKRALEDAQKEIFRAQEVVREVEARRREVEEEAVSLRRKVRKLNEERMVEIAREEGRQAGLQEGLEMGKDIGYLKGRNKGYVNGRMVADRAMEAYFSPVSGQEEEEVVRRSRGDLGDESDPPYTATTTRFPPSRSGGSSYSPSERDTPTPAHVPQRARTSTQAHNSQPPSARTTMYSPAHAHAEIPPDGWIPEADASHIIRLPPPHELARLPPTPGTPTPPIDPPLSSNSASASPRQPPVPIPGPNGDVPVLMIPEPKSPRGALYDVSARSHHTNAHRIQRRSSRDSIGTATTTRTSELDLLNAPEHVGRSTGGGGRRMSGLSAIPEVMSLQETISSGSMKQGDTGEDRVDEAGFVHVSMPTPRTPSEMARTKASSARASPHASLLSVNQTGGASRPNSASSFGTVNITVQPPSRPPSNISQATSTRPNLLSPADADRPVPLPSSQQTPSMAPLPTTGSTVPMALPDGGLPPGFVPTGLPTPAHSATGAEMHYTDYTGASVPLPPSSVGTYYSHLRGGPGPDTPAVIPPPSAQFVSRAEDRSDESASVSSSSDADTLTTPPMRYHHRPVRGSGSGASARSGYTGQTGYTGAGVPLPPSTVYSGYTGYTAAGVSLPPSEVGGGSVGTPYSYAKSPGYVNVDAGVTPAALGRTKSVSERG